MRLWLSLLPLVSGLTLPRGVEKTAPAPAKKEGPWRVSVRRLREKSVFKG